MSEEVEKFCVRAIASAGLEPCGPYSGRLSPPA
jgi:hypothetical protein